MKEQLAEQFWRQRHKSNRNRYTQLHCLWDRTSSATEAGELLNKSAMSFHIDNQVLICY